MDTIPYSNLNKGALLIASPEIDSGIYFRCVILLCEHSPTGSFGLIINKSLELELPEELVNLQKSTNPHVAIRAGGPIQPNQMMLLHSDASLEDHALKICEGVFLGGDLQFLQQAVNDSNGPNLRLCFGYTGWIAGQLEREFLSGNWFLFPGSSKQVFDTPPEKLWQTILREMGGKYATLSMIPEDLSLN
ncbi:MAG: YqgE/AlgH family protein [Chlamydiae bacterium]|nr:YqgE/AlgH family protein [Chlamydiota bacterium]